MELFIFAVIIVAFWNGINSADDIPEYCQFEVVQGRCEDPGSVILMDTARYGRMRSGGCITGEGYTGCSENVLPYLDSKCSGRRECEFQVASLSDVVEPCKRDFTSYLEASYTCVDVETLGDIHCNNRAGHHQLTATHGNLSSYIAMDKGQGGVSCPWEISGRPGQTIVLTVLDFSLANLDDDEEWQIGVYGPSNCPMALEIHDRGTTQEPLCGGSTSRHRERQIYVSSSDSIGVSFVAQRPGFTLQTMPHFLVHYEVTGCADLDFPAHTHVTRTSDTATVSCIHTQSIWYLTCDGVKWRGVLGNCSDTATQISAFESIFGHDIPVSQGIVIAIVIGVALGVALGTVLLAATLYLRRKRQQLKYTHQMREAPLSMQQPSNMYPTLVRADHDTMYNDSHPKYGGGYGTENTLDIRGHKVHSFPIQDRDLPRIPGGLTRSREPPVGHVYESPTPVMPHRGVDLHHQQNNQRPERTSEDCPVYFDLETDKMQHF